MVMPAAHGFITEHKWRKHICTMINLEAAASGGRETTLQVGPGHGWLMQAYRNAVPRPSGSAVVQLIFQTGVIPGETDFRIYRDHGGLSGFDFALFKNGYAYHTTNDDFEHVDHGTVQHYGENMLALVRELGNNWVERLVDPAELKKNLANKNFGYLARCDF